MNLGVDPHLSKSLPAPHIFAPSREDVLSTLAFFFGEPSVPEKLRDYSEHNAMTYHFPDACEPRAAAAAAAAAALQPRPTAALDGLLPRAVSQTTGRTQRSARRSTT